MSLNKLILKFITYYIILLFLVVIAVSLFGFKKGEIDPLLINIFGIYFIIKYLIPKFYVKNNKGLDKKEKSKFVIVVFAIVSIIQLVIYIMNTNGFSDLLNSTGLVILMGYFLIFYIAISFSVKYINDDYQNYKCPKCDKESLLIESREGYCTECKDVVLEKI